MMRVLITGGRAPVALDLARSFAASGATVFAADSAACFLARGSRAITRAFRVPPPRQVPQAFVKAIREIVRRERIDFVVPTCEEVFYLSRYADRLNGDTELFCADFPRLRELHDKWRFTQLAQGLGIDVPETWLLRTRGDVAGLTTASEKLVFKPVFSRFAVHTLICPPPQAVDGVTPTPDRAWIAQRYVEGRELCSYSVAREGRLTAHALYQPTWRAGRGSGFYFSPMASVAIQEFVIRFVAKTNYTGQIAFDFIESPGGAVHVLECNPRATSGLHLFRPGDRLADAFFRTPREIVRPGTEAPAMLGSAMLLIGTLDAVRRRRLRAFARDAAIGRDVLWSWRDPWPAVYLFAGLGATLFSAARRGISPQAASTRDIEWDGEELP